jgi:DNA invertase Pin-like site-specific DNA recombinase
MLSRLDEVQGIAVYDVDRLSRDYEDAVTLTFRLQRAGIKLYLARESIVETWDNNTSILIQHIKAWGADDERKKIKARQKEGIERFKAEHGTWGRGAKEIDWKEYDHYVKMGLPKTSIAKLLKVGRKTLYEKLKERSSKPSFLVQKLFFYDHFSERFK